MSIMVIQSGDQNAFKAGVDSAGRLRTRAITQSFEELAVELGDAYNLNTGSINFTNSATGVSYLKNNESQTIIITSYIYLFGNSTDGLSSEDGLVEVIENPTGGTLLTSTVGTPKNRNVSQQSKTIDVDWRIGTGSTTVTGGSTLIPSLFSSPTGRKVVSVKTALPKGGSIAIKYTPQASNSSQNVQFAMSIFKDVFN